MREKKWLIYQNRWMFHENRNFVYFLLPRHLSTLRGIIRHTIFNLNNYINILNSNYAYLEFSLKSNLPWKMIWSNVFVIYKWH